jgi:hypothetical protein
LLRGNRGLDRFRHETRKKSNGLMSGRLRVRWGVCRWQFKAKHMDAVVFFKMGKFYELFEMDAHVGVEHLGLQYMAGDQPHAGFPEKGYVA